MRLGRIRECIRRVGSAWFGFNHKVQLLMSCATSAPAILSTPIGFTNVFYGSETVSKSGEAKVGFLQETKAQPKRVVPWLVRWDQTGFRLTRTGGNMGT